MRFFVIHFLASSQLFYLQVALGSWKSRKRFSRVKANHGGSRNGGVGMNDVIRDLEDWLRVFEGVGDNRDETAVKCIKKALNELERYFDEYDNEDLRKSGDVKRN